MASGKSPLLGYRGKANDICSDCGLCEVGTRYSPLCIPCRKKARKAWKDAYRVSHREDFNRWSADWRERHPDKVKENWQTAYRKMREFNPERGRANVRRYQAKNKELTLERGRRWKRENPDKANALNHKRWTKQRGCAGEHTAQEWKAILKRHGGKCAICGVRGKMTKDHIIPISGGGSNFAFNLQPLCKSCNSRKNAKMPPGVQHSLFDSVAA